MSKNSATTENTIVTSKESFQITYYHLDRGLPNSYITNLVIAVGFENVKAVRKDDGSFKIFGLHAEGQKELDNYMSKF